MRFNSNVNVNFDPGAIMDKMDRATRKAQFMLDEQVVKDGNYFIPKDTGELERSSIRHTSFGSGEVVWVTPYARRLYHNPQYKFHKDVNPNAQGEWFEAAKAIYLTDWVKLMQEVYDDEFKG